MELNFNFQMDHGVEAVLLDPIELQKRYPDIGTEGVTLAVLSPKDGWIDPHGALSGLRRKAIALGATYVHGEVVGMDRDAKLVRSATLAGGRKITGQNFVNTAGLYAAQVAEFVGMKIPVAPLPRTQYYFETPATFATPLPLMRDQTGAGVRPEGRGFLSGLTDFSRVGQFIEQPDWNAFEETIWPMLARRVPKFEQVRLKNAWPAHYAQNTFDGNAIIGRWIGGCENFYMIGGCSGHGLQHAPAAGRAISELILDGDYRSIDLSRLSYRRIIDDQPYRETGVKA